MHMHHWVRCTLSLKKIFNCGSNERSLNITIEKSLDATIAESWDTTIGRSPNATIVESWDTLQGKLYPIWQKIDKSLSIALSMGTCRFGQ